MDNGSYSCSNDEELWRVYEFINDFFPSHQMHLQQFFYELRIVATKN